MADITAFDHMQDEPCVLNLTIKPAGMGKLSQLKKIRYYNTMASSA